MSDTQARADGPPPHRGLWNLLYTQNPFYLISAALVLYGIRAAYGDVQVGELNCWIMMLVISFYTAVVAATGVLIVRSGSVWDDARSILLVLCLLFVAISVCADELLMIDPDAALGLIGFGYLFSAVTSELVIRGLGIRMRRCIRIPFHLMLILLDVFPYFVSPEVWDLDAVTVAWRIWLFPQLFAVGLLTLWPAARGGASVFAENGTPWKWPWFPWTLFSVLTAIAMFRTYILGLSFGSTRMSDWDVTFGGYFFMPIVMALAILVLEAALAAKSEKFQRIVLCVVPVAVLISIPIGWSADFRRFLADFRDVFGSPVWLAVWGLVVFYLHAWTRRVSGAMWGVTATVGGLAIIGPETVSLQTLLPVESWPLGIAALLLIAEGIRSHSSPRTVAGWGVGCLALYFALTQWGISTFRWTISYHTFLVGLTVISLTVRDRFGVLLQYAAALQIVISGAIVGVSPHLLEIPLAWKAGYVSGLALCACAIGWGAASRLFLYAGIVNLSYLITGGTWVSYRAAVHVVSRRAMTALLWGTASLLIAVLISLSKAGKLRRYEEKLSSIFKPPPHHDEESAPNA